MKLSRWAKSGLPVEAYGTQTRFLFMEKWRDVNVERPLGAPDAIVLNAPDLRLRLQVQYLEELLWMQREPLERYRVYASKRRMDDVDDGFRLALRTTFLERLSAERPSFDDPDLNSTLEFRHTDDGEPNEVVLEITPNCKGRFPEVWQRTEAALRTAASALAGLGPPLRGRRSIAWSPTSSWVSFAKTNSAKDCDPPSPSAKEDVCYDTVSAQVFGDDIFTGGVWPVGCGMYPEVLAIEILPNWHGPADEPIEVRLRVAQADQLTPALKTLHLVSS